MDLSLSFEYLKYLGFIYASVCAFMYILTYQLPCCVTANSFEVENSPILLITAHPDDECMFFSPIISKLVNSEQQINLLCLTTGNFYGKGSIRREELFKSIKVLGISTQNIFIIDDQKIPDNNNVIWDSDYVQRKIVECFDEVNPKIVITFDNGGVSGHANHKAIYHTLRNFKLESGHFLHKDVKMYSLDTVNIARKFSSFLDIPISYWTSDLMFVSSPGQIFTGQRAMFSHWSQLEWFRILYIIFSRYMIVNTLTEIK